jgi:predicted ATPase
MRFELPSGTVTFLFTDVEGSTRLLHELGAEAYAEALAEHRRLVREACAAHGGVEVDTQGDAFFFAFPTAHGALAAASAFTEALVDGPIQVRVGLHTGEPLVTEEGYVGDDVHFAARVAAAGHGGQVICSAATAELVASPLTDLGEHRLKDIAEAVSIFQLGSSTFPPLKTISNSNLPRPASSFVGREVELEAVLSRIEGGARLVTLTGPGGSGKTRLAIEAASTLVPEYKAGVFWVGLAPLRDPALVSETIARTLGAKDGLAEHIGERELLLVLDNLEQVIESAAELASLLERCPNLALLVTSRERLRVRGEVEYEVPPLAEPEAVELFYTRSQLGPSEEIGELCARLDNLPLAVELAAARTKALSPAQILERLSERLDLLQGGRDAEPRQQTLRATIEWSHDLLDADEQRLFARLSVFARGCTLVAAEEVAAADLDTVQSLVEKGLVRFTDERYWMLETIREFAAERLAESGDEGELRQRHARFFLEVATSLGMSYESIEVYGRQCHDVAIAEQENFRSAIDWAFEDDVELAARIAVALEGFWVALSPFEGARRFEALVERDERLPYAVRAGCWRCLASSSLIAGGRNEDGISQYERSLDLYRRAGDERGIAIIQQRLGVPLHLLGNAERGRALLEESVARCRALRFRVGEAAALGSLGRIEYSEGNVERGLELVEQSAELARVAGFVYMEAYRLDQLASYVLELGRLDEALGHIRAVLRLSHTTRDRLQTVVSLARMAGIAAKRQESTRAGRLWGGIEAEEARGPLGFWEQRREELAAPVLAVSGPEFERGRVAGRRLTLDETVEYALVSID